MSNITMPTNIAATSPNTKRAKIRAELLARGYRLVNWCAGPESIGTNLEFFAGPDGMIIVQEWPMEDAYALYLEMNRDNPYIPS